MDVLKFLNATNLQILLEAINDAYSKGEIPLTWTVAKVICIFKKGNAHLPVNYRPISLLESIYKLYAKMILNRIQPQVDQVLRKTQFGFRKNRSTSDPIHIVRRAQDLFKSKASPLHLFFIDWRQAFDKVLHPALRRSLISVGIPIKIVDAIMSMYKKPLFFVSEQGHNSNTYEARAGIRQGCPLSPFLFIIVLSEMFKLVDKRIEQESISTNLISHRRPLFDLEYADDVLLMHAHLPSLQRIILILEEEAAKFGLSMNLQKTVHMPCFCTHTPPKLKLRDGHEIPQVTSYKYLGVIITANGDPYTSINSRLGEASHMFNNLRPVWNNKFLNLKYKVRVFKAIFEKKIAYAAQHSVLNATNEKRINSWHVQKLRRVASIKHSFWSRIPNKTVYKRTKSVPFSLYIDKLQMVYLGHVMRADPDDPIRFIAFNDFLLHRQFYSTSSNNVGRPTPRWTDIVLDKIKANCPPIVTKRFRALHPALNLSTHTPPQIAEIAADRLAFRAIAHNPILRAYRTLPPDSDEDDPPPPPPSAHTGT